MSKAENIRIFLLGSLVALVAVAVFRPGGNEAQAQAVVGQSGSDLEIHVDNNGKDCPTVFIFDLRKRRFAYYTQQTSSNSERFRLWAVRPFDDDLQLDGDYTKAGGATVKDVRDELKKQQRR